MAGNSNWECPTWNKGHTHGKKQNGVCSRYLSPSLGNHFQLLFLLETHADFFGKTCKYQKAWKGTNPFIKEPIGKCQNIFLTLNLAPIFWWILSFYSNCHLIYKGLMLHWRSEGLVFSKLNIDQWKLMNHENGQIIDHFPIWSGRPT